MRVPFYDIKAQYDELKTELDAAALAVLSSGVYTISGGKECGFLEQELADLHGVKHGISVHSGTDALRIMMDAVGIGPGDEVITTAFTFVASVETIVQTGATPIFVDIDPLTYNMDPANVEAAITSRTKAILPIHLFGQLADIDAIKAIADKHGLIILEDSAQALGCHKNGTYTGHYGSAAAFSFYVTKNLGAIGDAGLILTNDDAVAEACRSIRVHGMGRQRYYYDHLGYTSRMDEIQAALLRVKLTKLSEWNSNRAKWAAIYREKLQNTGIQLPVTLPGNNNTWHQYSIRSDRRDGLQAYLKEQGVDSMVYYPVPIHFHSPYAKFGHGEGSLPESEKAAREILNLPIHPHLTAEQVEHAADALLAFHASAAAR